MLGKFVCQWDLSRSRGVPYLKTVNPTVLLRLLCWIPAADCNVDPQRTRLKLKSRQQGAIKVYRLGSRLAVKEHTAGQQLGK